MCMCVVCSVWCKRASKLGGVLPPISKAVRPDRISWCIRVKVRCVQRISLDFKSRKTHIKFVPRSFRNSTNPSLRGISRQESRSPQTTSSPTVFLSFLEIQLFCRVCMRCSCTTSQVIQKCKVTPPLPGRTPPQCTSRVKSHQHLAAGA